MDVKRAKDIAASPIMARVTHNGTQVYIQDVDEQAQMANVYHLKNPDERHQVHVKELSEDQALQ